MSKKYKPEPIISLLGGYQRYFGGNDISAASMASRDPTNKQKSQLLYKVEGTGVKGNYVGNYVLYRFLNSVSDLTRQDAESLDRNFVQQYAARGTEIIQRYVGDVKSAFAKTRIPVSRADVAEEQFKAVKGREPAKGKFGQQKVDLVGVPGGLGNIQVTSSRLDRSGHHGIYGKQGASLKTSIDKIHDRFKAGAIDKETKDKQIANEGLSYFKGRIPTWNKALASIKKSLDKNKYKKATPATMHGAVAKVARNPLPKAAASGIADMAQKGAAEITLQALGNLKYYGNTGVSYSYGIGRNQYVIIQKLLMDPQTYQFSSGALKDAFTVNGMYATDMYFASNVGSANEAAMRRGFAHHNYIATGSTGYTELGSIQALSTGAAEGNKRLTANIDMIHADKALARKIKEDLIPAAQEQLSKESRKFTNSKLGNNEVIKFKGKLAWALPYLGVLDEEYTHFGDK